MYAFKECRLPKSHIEHLELNASTYWNDFYRRNADKFFKDRHWLGLEFPQLQSAKFIVEVGCGTGSAAFPLLERNTVAYVYACDFASRAVDLVRQHPLYVSGRITAFVADITKDNLVHLGVPGGKIDACTMLFVLSAVAPHAMPAALANIAGTLIPEAGRIYFRDYAEGDLAETRFQAFGRQQCLGNNFFVRGDGTRAYYFSEDGVRKLFSDAGFICEQLAVIDQTNVNHRRGIVMNRKFVQGVFRFTGDATSSAEPENEAVVQQLPLGRSGPIDNVVWDVDSISSPEHKPSSAYTKEFRVILGPMMLHLAVPSHAIINNYQAGGAAHTLAQVVLRCPELLLNMNIVEIGCGPAALPALAAVRWCRRALALDHSHEAIATLHLNALRNGHQFAFERLRVLCVGHDDPMGWLKEGRATLALGGLSVDVVLAACSSEDSILRVLEWICAFLEAENGIFVVVAVARPIAAAFAAAAQERRLSDVPPPQALLDVVKSMALQQLFHCYGKRR